MKIGFITNLRAPYRTLQFNEFSKIKNIEITVYYCNAKNSNRQWNTGSDIKFKEVDLDGYKLFNKYGYINKGLLNIVKNNDILIIGGYDQPTYILLSLICRILKKSYILLFDGISTNKISKSEKSLKKIFKSMVINSSCFIMGNGEVSKRYFNEAFGYPCERIYNQYLTVDSKKINSLYEDRKIYRKMYRDKLNINDKDVVLVYSGRLISIKNVEALIKAVSILNRDNIVILITGGGELEEELKSLSQKLGVKIIVTGFIYEQENLFKHYFAGDLLILPSIEEPWGLVVNEAMLAGLPVIVSQVCGCSLDLVKDGYNGYLINPNDINDIKLKLELVIESNLKNMGKNSRKMIANWNFSESRKEFEKIINILNVK